MRILEGRATRLVASFTTAIALCSGPVALADNGGGYQQKILEVNVTRNDDIASQEPQIAVNPLNPQNIVYVSNYTTPKELSGMQQVTDVSGRGCFLGVSGNGGLSWTPVTWPADGQNPNCHHAGVVVDARGVFYVGFNPLGGSATDGVKVAWSTDGGRHWSVPTATGNRNNGMRLRVDTPSGQLYQASGFGPHTMSMSNGLDPRCDPRDAQYDQTVPQQQCLTWTVPRSFPGIALAVHDGFVATATQRTPVDVTVLQPIYRYQYGESQLWFSVSADDGVTYTDHAVTGATGVRSGQVQVTADPMQRGRFAVAQYKDNHYEVFVTPDAGLTWTGPAVIAAPNSDPNRAWLDFGSTGVLGLVWHKIDAGILYTAISYNGLSFGAPLRINSVSHPFAGGDNAAWISLDGHSAYVGWGDARSGLSNGYFARVALRGQRRSHAR